MGRKIVCKAERYWYAPDVGDNRDDPEPFEVLISPLTLAESRQLERSTLGKMTRRGVQESAFARAQRHVEEVIRSHVHGVRRYEIVAPDGKCLVPTDGASLLDALQHAPDGEASTVIDDLFDEIRGRSELDEELGKGSRSPSASTRAATPTAGDGAAADARATAT